MPIDPKLFDAYLGQYELGPNVMLRIFREDNKLWAQTGPRPRSELFAASETTFFMRGPDAELTFVRDAGGAVTHLVLRRNHLAGEARKVD